MFRGVRSSVNCPKKAPLSSLRLGELCEEDFPPGVVKIGTGVGTTGSALVHRKDVSRMGFAGSVETGRIVAREAVGKFKGATLEPGDENPIVTIPDADPKKAAATLRPVGGGPCREGINGPLAEECGSGYHLSRDPEECCAQHFRD
ncbi:MAG: aldehyde dehydrogenase family protein [Rhodobacteraceae bacterium]|nr:aldehyde dehydrogenase family protein [Paracoccaceae bacterium]